MVTWLGLSAYFLIGLSHFSIEADIKIEQVRGKETMDITLWIIQIILAAGFVYSGWMKTIRIESSKKMWAWVDDVPKSLVVLIGIAELLGALGLVLPWALNIAPLLTPIAAMALAAVTFLGMLFHIRRSEYRELGVNLFFMVLALIVTFGRL
ncbi:MULTISPECIES: DoxX family protein [unclassified Paenibacillus]|uniref:DoxX family protein n=1 Tax=unclassified Paenibacillus TaxID=185978 RepID=UPI0008B2F592|nr:MULTISPECIES: DoxX family protein [unclassified Paenibacillus]SEO76577.1 DoxX-like family protein [Paenibacillus sp. OK076]